jgi:hypothetical protein
MNCSNDFRCAPVTLARQEFHFTQAKQSDVAQEKVCHFVHASELPWPRALTVATAINGESYLDRINNFSSVFSASTRETREFASFFRSFDRYHRESVICRGEKGNFN